MACARLSPDAFREFVRARADPRPFPGYRNRTDSHPDSTRLPGVPPNLLGLVLRRGPNRRSETRQAGEQSVEQDASTTSSLARAHCAIARSFQFALVLCGRLQRGVLQFFPIGSESSPPTPSKWVTYPRA